MKITSELLLLGPLQYKEKVGNGDFLLFYNLILRNYGRSDVTLMADMPQSERLSRETYPTSSNRYGKDNNELATLYSYSDEYLAPKKKDYEDWKRIVDHKRPRFPVNFGKSIVKSYETARAAKYLKEYLAQRNKILSGRLQIELQRNYSNYSELNDAIRMAMVELRDVYKETANYNSVGMSEAKVYYDRDTDVIQLLVKDDKGKENVVELPKRDYGSQSQEWKDIFNPQYLKRQRRFL